MKISTCSTYNIYKTILIMSISTLFSCSTCSGQDKGGSESVRPMAVAGSFYPSTKDSVIQMLSEYFQHFNVPSNDNVAAVIVPHAGYVFSGAVAASAFAQINSEREYEHIFLIGPSHHVYMDGASTNNAYDYYGTPLGKVKVDKELCSKLIHDCPYFSCNPDAHIQEHCLEVQLPFLQYHLKKMPPIVPIIVATQSLSTIKKIAEVLKPYFNEKNLFVISSDFSHYPSYDDAKTVDGRTGKAIETGSLDNFLEALSANEKEHISNLATSACGQSAIATLLCITSKLKDIEIHHIQYRNSGDSEYGDHLQVVGYHAFCFTRKRGNDPSVSFSLTDKEKTTLLKIARTTIQNKLTKERKLAYDKDELTETLLMHCGAFVTLNENKQLRGCIGLFGNDMPLYKVVEEMAESAAFGDPRFFPVRKDELDKIDIEISVLSPMKKIKNIDQFILGKQGIYISKGGRSGTFLPQVEDETHWSKEEFLGHCARDKAGLAWDGWKDADLYTYEALVFREK